MEGVEITSLDDETRGIPVEADGMPVVAEGISLLSSSSLVAEGISSLLKRERLPTMVDVTNDMNRGCDPNRKERFGGGTQVS